MEGVTSKVLRSTLANLGLKSLPEIETNGCLGSMPSFSLCQATCSILRLGVCSGRISRTVARLHNLQSRDYSLKMMNDLILTTLV